ncbi:diacylglycerol acyltransferase [Trichuris suis]|nr:hypothetical protein M513_12881 [Trichuris suis]KHJ46502.1 diacylglycerol acyltransferase [Trichuris suis]
MIIKYSKAEILIESCLQTLSVGANLFMLVLGPATSVWLSWFVFFHTRVWWLVPLYFVWYIYDFESPKYGSHMSVRFRRLRLFKYLVSYFPISIRKTAELNPSENYLIANHPHGIISVGAFANFLTDANSFSKLFPGIRSYLCTLDLNFFWPIRREYLQLLGKNGFASVKSTVDGLSSATCSGAVSRSKESVGYLISRPGGGNAVVIVVGGAEEALESEPGAHRIILRERKGFVKVAIKYG